MASIDPSLFRLIVLKNSLSLWIKTGIKPVRGVGRNDMIRMASEFTGETYPMSKRGAKIALYALEKLHQEILDITRPHIYGPTDSVCAYGENHAQQD